MDMEKIRDDILLATLPNVVFDGWSQTALREGATAAGYESSMAFRAFPRGIPELVEHFSTWADREMVAELERREVQALRVRDRITLAIRVRLEILAPHQEPVRRVLAFLALPQNGGLAARLLYRTVDTMWYAAGDTATDFSYYTKRGLLAAVVSATTLYWLDDRSEDHRDSWGFLDRRIADVMTFGRTMGRAQDLAGLLNHFPSPFRFARQFRRHTSQV